MKHKLQAFVAIGALSYSTPTLAQSCAEFTASSAELRLYYDPYEGASLERTFTLRVRQLDSAVTGVRFLLADPDPEGSRPRLGINGPAYEMVWARDSGRRIFALGGEQPNNTNGALVRFGSTGSSKVADEVFRVRVPAGEDLAAGNYYQPIDIVYQCFAGDDAVDGARIQSDGRVAVDLVVPERVTSYIGSQGIRRGTLDFGSLVANSNNISRSLSITTQATVPYEVEFSTLHGSLKRSGDDPASIPYRSWFANLPVRDGSRVGCARSSAPRGSVNVLRAEVDGRAAASVPAGTYGEEITITFSPRLGLSGGNGCSALRY